MLVAFIMIAAEVAGPELTPGLYEREGCGLFILSGSPHY